MHERQEHQRSRSLRARGNLSYLGFVRLVQMLWSESHPDIPVLPTGGSSDGDAAVYPCILYGLELRQVHRSDPKPRFRETISEDGAKFLVHGQRFQNVVSFTVMTEHDALLADEVIEAFETFMMEMTPVFKELGASEFVYSRRYSDNEIRRPGEGVVIRRVAYMLTTEAVTSRMIDEYDTIIGLLNKIDINAQVSYGNDEVTTHGGSTWFQEISPRYFVVGQQYPIFLMNNDDIDQGLISVPRTSFLVGDIVYLTRSATTEQSFPPELDAGYYVISNIVGAPFSNDIKYEISFRNEAASPSVPDFGPTGTEDSNGYVYYGQILYRAEFAVTSRLV